MCDTEELFPFDSLNLSNDKSEKFPDGLNNDTDSNFNKVREKDEKYVELILQGMGMEKHLDKFITSKISLNTFLHLNQSDLINIGITDAEDIKTILENLEIHSKSSEDLTIYPDLNEDLIIAKNVYNQLVRLQAYAAFLVLKLTKEKFIDCEGGKLYSPTRYLKYFANSAISQCDIMAESIYGQNNSDNLIEKLLKVNVLELPKCLEKKILKEQKTKSKRHALHLLMAISGIVGVSVAAFIWKKRLL